MNESTASESTAGENSHGPKRLSHNSNKKKQNEIRRGSRYNREANSTGQSGQSGIEFTFEVREVTGPEGRQLTLAQARALRRALEWAAAYAQQTHDESPGAGEEKPRAA